MKGVFH